MSASRKKPLRLIIFGACGRMGRAVTRLADEADDVAVAALVEKQGHPAVASTLELPHQGSSIEILDRIPASASRRDIVIDFSDRRGFLQLMTQLGGSGLRLVSGTTGLDTRARGDLKRYAATTAVLHDTNMSFGISVLKRLFARAHAHLSGEFDTEIIETHHRYKKDFPSGTALSLAREVAGENAIITGRGRKRSRDRGTLHLHSVRTGGIPGDHQIVFASDEEVVTLSHRAISRDVFARGALRAARFIAGKRSGLYSMKHVVGT